MKIEDDSIRASYDIGASPSPIEINSESSKPVIHIRPSVAYDVAASAASYLHSTAKGLLTLGQKSESYQEDPQMEPPYGADDGSVSSGFQPYPSRLYDSKVAAHVATTAMTAVVAAEEAVKQEAAKELQSLHSSPCEWFICDDPSTYTRCFTIQVCSLPQLSLLKHY